MVYSLTYYVWRERKPLLILLPNLYSESRSYLVVAVVCVSFVFLLAALTIKYFFMDLVLFGRRFLKCCKASSGEYITMFSRGFGSMF
jgi:hypothetical protein